MKLSLTKRLTKLSKRSTSEKSEVSMTDESVIDFPKESLCPDVWEKVIDQDGVNETWQLRQDVRQQVQQLYD